ncbi:MAG: hypothetical protein QOJ79_1431 [Actinomycetota bacterium]|jgi:hypothetical protein|nr:hypothetical protein [Actinomycetota bacterium]
MAHPAHLRAATVLAALLTLTLSVLHYPRPLHTAAASTSMTGTYQLVAAQGREGVELAHEYQDVLVVGDKTYALKLHSGARPPSGTTVHVSGTKSGSTVEADSLTTGGTAATSTATAAKTQKLTRVLVILATWNSPDAVTPAQAVQQVGSDDGAWLADTSYGEMGLSATATPWLHISGPDGGRCWANQSQIMDQAKSAAAGAGFGAAAYDRTMLYFPHADDSDCAGYGGWSYQPGTDIWINGMMDRRTTVHELGHAMGLMHASSLSCTAAGTPVPLSSTCTTDVYGDATDAMGSSGYAAQYSAIAKDRMGWLAGRTADLTNGGTANLAPMAGNTTGTVAATIKAGARTYYLEYRKPVGEDATLPGGLAAGAVVHVVDPSIAPNSLLLDMTPGGNVLDAALLPGHAWVTPEGTTIRVGRPVDGRLPVSVSRTAQDVTPPAAVTGLTAKVVSGKVSLSWTKPGSDAAAVEVRKMSSSYDASCVACADVYTGTKTTATAPASALRMLTFTVSARDAAGNVSPSRWVTLVGTRISSKSV